MQSRTRSMKSCTAKFGYLTTLAEDMNTKIGQLSSNETQVKAPFGYDSCGSENEGDCLLFVEVIGCFSLVRSAEVRVDCVPSGVRPPGVPEGSW